MVDIANFNKIDQISNNYFAQQSIEVSYFKNNNRPRKIYCRISIFHEFKDNIGKLIKIIMTGYENLLE